MAAASVAVIASHRRCPLTFKRFDFFADRHVIEDSYALRYLESRIGAAFTVVLVFVVVALVVFITEPRNNSVLSGGIKPATASLKSTAGYGTLRVELLSFAPTARVGVGCASIALLSTSDALR